MRPKYLDGRKLLHIYTIKSAKLRTPVYEEFRFPLTQVNISIVSET
jgi:hypothetical protein